MLWMAGLILAMTNGCVLNDGYVSFHFDGLGNLTALRVRGETVPLQPPQLPISLRVDGQWWHDNPPPTQPLRTSAQRHRADITFRAGDFVVTVHYRLHKGGVLQKQVTVRYEGDGHPRVDGVLFWLPAVALGDDAVVLGPSFDFLRVPLEHRPRFNIDMGTGAWCVLFAPRRKLGVAATFYSDTEHYSVTADTVDIVASTSRRQFLALRVHHWLGVQDRVSKGWSAELGTQFFAVAEGDEQAVLTKLWDAYEAAGLRPLRDTPADAFDGAFYSTWSDYRTLRRLLPHLRQIGVKTLWLLPYTPGVYAPLDYYAIRPEVGTPDDLKALVAEAHRMGMRVLLDLIPHGPRPESSLGKEQRALLDAGKDSWICTDEQGKPIHWWGCYAFDYAHPGWIGYMAEVAAHFAREFGIDGWRVDVAAGGPPNWSVVQQPFPRRRPSQSGLWGALRILDEARKAVKTVRGDAVFYPEASGPPFVVHGDFDYGFPFHFAAMRWMEMPPEEFVPKLRRWLHHQRFTFPQGGSKRIVRWLENHDFPDAKGRLGIDAARALFAVTVVSEGVPLLFENQDIGMSEFIARLMRLRSSLAELRDGDANYLTVQVSDDRVFVVHRFHRQQHTVALVNLSGEPVAFQVRLPSPMANWARVGDAWRGQTYRIRNGTVSLTLAPFALAVLTDEKRALQQAQKVVKPEPLRMCPVTLSDESVLRIGETAVGQWHEGAYKIAPGEPLPAEVAEVRREGERVTGKLVLKRRMGAVVRRVAEIDWRWQQSKAESRYEAQWRSLLPVKIAHHDLAWQFSFSQPRRWRIATVEGTMEEPFVVRQAQPQLLWEATRLPASLTEPTISVQLADGCWWGLTEWQGSNLQVWLNPDGTLIVRLLPDEQGRLAFASSLDRNAPSLAMPTVLSAESGRMHLSTPSLRLTVARYRGGLPVWMMVRRAKAKKTAMPQWQRVIVGSELYSDYGIFPDRDEGGAWRAEGERRTVRTVGRASACRYPERVMVGRNSIAFEGALATTWAGHWWHLNPRINYSLRYETDGNGILMHAAVTPVKPLRKVRAFLALTLTFVGVQKVTVNTVKGWHEVPEIGERDWQSRQLPLAPTPNGQIRLHTTAGVVALEAIDGELQNCFVLRDGDRCTVFFAWLDGEATDFANARPLRFRIALAE